MTNSKSQVMSEQNKPFIQMQSTEKYQPQEKLFLRKTGKQQFLIGVPKETILQEKRVAIVPSAAALLVENGHRVIIERGAGLLANFEDRQYAEAGAELMNTAQEVFQADIIIKVAPPTLEEIRLMKDRIILISSLHIRAQDKNYYRALMNKKITALSYEHIRNQSNEHPVLHSISEIVGNTSILIAAHYLASPQWGRGKMLGGFTGINPSEVVILGAGIVAEGAAKAAIGLGAMVKVFDNSISKLRRLQNNLQSPIYTSILQPDVLAQALSTADVAIGAIYIRSGDSLQIVSEAMIQKMKKGSIIVDVSIDRGGCFETSKETNHLDPVYQQFGVTHYCVPNISSRTPHTASYALSNYFAPFLLEMADYGGISPLLIEDQGIRSGIYLFHGKLTFSHVAKQFNLGYQDLSLILATFR